ncbi:hypothetical protein KP509_14G084100 [Ceratopteris richardii]|uniref:Uncharacterized protein n=1 Tax=Ceratopteris richardii TaxID=49495 RepID=A0A8T2TDT6_CERRI|nr:hypothetical protein KP509_14G084100 [Ceratopteris richardii]
MSKSEYRGLLHAVSPSSIYKFRALYCKFLQRTLDQRGGAADASRQTCRYSCRHNHGNGHSESYRSLPQLEAVHPQSDCPIQKRVTFGLPDGIHSTTHNSLCMWMGHHDGAS